MNFILIHGTYGNPDENWFPWLKKELERLGYEVLAPKFPTPKNQSLDSWLNVFKGYEKYVDKETVFIGHSLGPAFILKLVERFKVRACFFVAGFLGSIDNPDFDKINASFFEQGFDWDKIKKNCKNFFVYNSDNDPYVDASHGEKIASNLGVNLKVIKGAGHFNAKAGYSKFDLLLKDIKTIIY